MIPRLDIPDDTRPDDLPPGWRFGAYVSEPGWEGWYILHSSGRSVIARSCPDLTLVRLEDPEQADPARELDIADLEAELARLLQGGGS